MTRSQTEVAGVFRIIGADSNGTAGVVRRWILEQPVRVLRVRLLEGEGPAVRDARDQFARARAEDAAVSVEVRDRTRADAGARRVPTVRVECDCRISRGHIPTAAICGDAPGVAARTGAGTPDHGLDSQRP